jgi:prevent-host-death family protein
MDQVSVRDLRNHGGDVLDRVEAGERLTVTRNGKPVAELVPIARRGLTRDEILRRARTLPAIDPAELRADIDALLDTRLFTGDE